MRAVPRQRPVAPPVGVEVRDELVAGDRRHGVLERAQRVETEVEAGRTPRHDRPGRGRPVEGERVAVLDLLVHEPGREQDERRGRERRGGRPPAAGPRVEARDDDDRDEHGKRPGTRQRRQPEKAARDEARRDRPGGAQAADGDHDTAGRERHRECLGVVHRRRPDERGRGGDEHERHQVERPPAGPELPREEEHEHAGRKTGGRREELTGPLDVLPPGGRREAAETAGEGEPERRRVPDTGLVLRRQPVVGRDDVGVAVVGEGVVAPEPVVVPGVPGEERRLGGQDPADRERVPAARELSTHSRTSPVAGSGTAGAARGRRTGRGRRAGGRDRRPRRRRAGARPRPRSSRARS